jgi:hypothetical protein
MPRKIVINRRYGGFGLSHKVKEMYMEETKSSDIMSSDSYRRDDPILIRIIETLGLPASAGNFSKLKIIELPDDVPDDGWVVQEYDGMEWVAEKHRTWAGSLEQPDSPGAPETLEPPPQPE